jgi:hypothetical protein
MRGEREHIVAAQKTTPAATGSDSDSVEVLDSDHPAAQRAKRRMKKTYKSRALSEMNSVKSDSDHDHYPSSRRSQQ